MFSFFCISALEKRQKCYGIFGMSVSHKKIESFFMFIYVKSLKVFSSGAVWKYFSYVFPTRTISPVTFCLQSRQVRYVIVILSVVIFKKHTSKKRDRLRFQFRVTAKFPYWELIETPIPRSVSFVPNNFSTNWSVASAVSDRPGVRPFVKPVWHVADVDG